MAKPAEALREIDARLAELERQAHTLRQARAILAGERTVAERVLDGRSVRDGRIVQTVGSSNGFMLTPGSIAYHLLATLREAGKPLHADELTQRVSKARGEDVAKATVVGQAVRLLAKGALTRPPGVRNTFAAVP